MSTYIILSRFSPEAFDNPKHFLELAEQVSKKIRQECPNLKW
ncbi:MAG: GYD family protein, partial [Deltaproteobacteria bacterium]